MATEHEVLAALAQHHEALRELGVWGLGSRAVSKHQPNEFVVVASVTPQFVGTLPKTLSCIIDGKKVVVPLKMVRDEKPRPEKL